jgi:hypothetical protein
VTSADTVAPWSAESCRRTSPDPFVRTRCTTFALSTVTVRSELPPAGSEEATWVKVWASTSKIAHSAGVPTQNTRPAWSIA